jgi:hypothetical protein
VDREAASALRWNDAVGSLQESKAALIAAYQVGKVADVEKSAVGLQKQTPQN